MAHGAFSDRLGHDSVDTDKDCRDGKSDREYATDMIRFCRTSTQLLTYVYTNLSPKTQKLLHGPDNATQMETS